MEDLVFWALVHDAGVFPSGLEQMAHHFAAGNLVQNSLYSPAAPSRSKEADSQMDRIILSDQIYQQIHLHLIHALPMEAVGIVGGLPDGLARLVIEMPNLAGPHEFFADPFAQRTIYRPGVYWKGNQYRSPFIGKINDLHLYAPASVASYQAVDFQHRNSFEERNDETVEDRKLR